MTTAETAEADGAIVCSDLVRVFSTRGVEVQALQGLSLHVDAGSVVAVVGASGSGKSTLLGILSGLDVPTAGRAVVADHDLLSMGRSERVRFRRNSVGFVWQQTARNLLPYLTAGENVSLVGAVGRQSSRRRAVLADELLELLGVADCRDRRPPALSGGQQQRVAIAVAMANAPRVLLADEPTGELDDAASAEVLGAMNDVSRERGTTVLIVTHDATVTEHVSRTVQIRDGRTSTEVLRRASVDESGEDTVIAEEYAVLDRVGRLQLPDEFTRALDLRHRVRLALESDHVGVWPGERHGTEGADDRGPRTNGDGGAR
ncbi:ABC transporter ATP-binding protein [Mumia sp. zg.B53]|uniref:ABC transporter ATP-binding protein n=1 Tax=unclassified Mumia TaxID=2621872 RepID=UPI001C6DFA6B|nr:MULTISPECIES: ABC transporter ATP-binding protein [unclassified Mumia]MBW9207594.1 ABC transporter ATP-binding protein [Mumia sp. zg.B17]MBW9210060.1 ABC transporter ATP-binding protein [Mumia sp. zg.B21]MBW9214664.1 ABC transporter ATP-binding protein [Mumia sp. zg.B53]